MKRWAAVIMILALMITGTAQAVQWPEGRSAAQPYAGTPPLDLDKTMGYIVLSPRPKMPAQYFCDRLYMFLPRDDVELARGAVRVMRENAGGRAEEIVSMDFSDTANVRLRPMTEWEMECLLWGSGVCIEIQLPVSLELNGTGYYVTMDEGCFTACGGALKSLAIDNPEAWTLTLQGDYGISKLYYTAPEEEADGAPVYKAQPEAGDRVCFDLVLGGEAAYAVIYSENDSVSFTNVEYTESESIEGTVTGDSVNWGVVFLDAAGEMLKAVTIVR